MHLPTLCHTSGLLLGFSAFNKVHAGLGIYPEHYQQLTLGFVLKNANAIFLSHHRKTSTYLQLIKKCLLPSLKLIHIAHNEFNTLKHLSVLPKKIIAVSEKVKQNHVQYFGAKSENIQVIYNGIEESFYQSSMSSTCGKIKILYPARINEIKQQLAIVAALRGKINENIEITFAGEGPDLDALRLAIANLPQFNSLGFVSDIAKIYSESDYIMLFSKQEGLPLSLIEACMHSKVIICNNVGGNTEIANVENSFFASNFEDLIKVLNNLPLPESEQYQAMAGASRSTYLNNFTQEKMIKAYQEYLLAQFPNA